MNNQERLRILEQAQEEARAREKRCAEHVYNCDSEHVTIPTEEYEKLIGNLHHLQNIENIMTEYHMKRKLLQDNPIENSGANQQAINRLRRTTVTKISQELRVQNGS